MTGPGDAGDPVIASIVAESQVQVARLKAEAGEQTARIQAELARIPAETTVLIAGVCRDCRLDDEPLNETGRCWYCADLLELQAAQDLAGALADREEMSWPAALAVGLAVAVMFYGMVFWLIVMLPGGGP